MINRSARQYQEALLPVSILESDRKFGNPVNRSDKFAQFSKQSSQRSNKANALRKIRPQLFYNENQEGYQQQNEKKYIISSFDPISSQSNSVLNQDSNKKQKQNRNRQFVAKVENINKMHEQINSLLQYVKNGSSKSLIKNKQIPQQRSKTIKKPFKNQLNRRSIAEVTIQQSQIIPITQNQRNYKQSGKMYHLTRDEKLRQIEKRQEQQLPSKLTNNYLNYRQVNTDDYKRNIKNIHEGYNNQETQYNLRKNVEIKKSMQMKKNTQNLSPMYKNYKEYKNLVNNHQTKELTPNKPKYNYSYDNQDLTQIMKSKNIKKSANQNPPNTVDYDYQINKVKQRIQYSEQMTKKMQEKYLGSYQMQKSYNASIIKGNYENISQEQNKLYRFKQQNKNGKNNEKQFNFQLKVYPCQAKHNTTHNSNQKISRDQICKLIAEKISEQIKLDQKLRDARQIFNECKNPQKWNLLQKKLKQLGYSFTLSELENELNITSTQSNPFNKDPNNKGNSINQLAQKYAKSQQYWQKKFFHFLPRKTIQQSGFSVKQMDLDQRGYLTIQDIVCFVNLYSSNFFRNRDALYLFRRLVALGKTRNGVQYPSFLNIISSE